MQYSPPSVQSIRVWVWREACHSGAQRVANWLCLFACSNPKPTVYKFPGRTGPVRLVMWERAR
jgi:hypothetical protein